MQDGFKDSLSDVVGKNGRAHAEITANGILDSLNLLGGSIPLADLFKIIFKKIHPLFSIDCGIMLLYDAEITHIQEAYISTYIAENDEVLTEVLCDPIELDLHQKEIAVLSFPVLKSIDDWVNETGSNHKLINSQDSYKYHCYIPLEVDNQVLGTLELHNNTTELSAECLTFCSTIADILAEVIFAKKHQKVSPTVPKEIIVEKKRKLISNDLAYEKINLDEEPFEGEELYLEERTRTTNHYSEIVGAGPEMARVFDLMDQVAGSESTVLILGETGTGKELIARALHTQSARKDNLIIKVNCAAIPTNLIESELFGHERGAFTGATDRRLGKFELADNSTIFLDEIGELPLDLQVKLLRVLQEQEIERVGGKATIKINVRIISATNRNLLEEVEAGTFRRDLYYRLNVFPISLPALRERKDDIPVLASHFLMRYASKSGKQITGFTQRALQQMMQYNWPGNVRELEHLIERQVLLSKRTMIAEIDIPVKEKLMLAEDSSPQRIKTIDENERDHIFAVLQYCKGRISGPDGAAKLLGVPATTLNSKLKRLGLSKKHF